MNLKFNGIHPYTAKELASIYHMSKKTFQRRLKPFSLDLGEKVGWYYSIFQVELIVSRLGCPRDNIHREP